MLYITLVIVHIIEVMKRKLSKNTIQLIYLSLALELFSMTICIYSLWKNYKLYKFQKETEYVPLETYD